MTHQIMPLAAYVRLAERARALFGTPSAGPPISLMFTPPELQLGPGEVLVAEPSPDGVKLHPQQLVPAGDAGPAAARGVTDRSVQHAAAALASRLWTAVLRAGGPHPAAPVPCHLPAFFGPGDLDMLGLPIRAGLQATQTIALADHEIELERPGTPEAVATAYAAKRRTRVYEGLHARSVGPWSLAAMLLSHLAWCKVSTTIYESDAADATMGEHLDDWYGIIVQVDGDKVWALRTDPAAEPQHVHLHAGDVLLLPRGVHHDVSTPEGSTHVLFAVQTHKPLT
jgi:hypothetical protein